MAAADTLTEEQLAELHEMQAEHDAAIEPDDEDRHADPERDPDLFKIAINNFTLV